MVQVPDLAVGYPEIMDVLRDRALMFPIDTKHDFVEQFVTAGPEVVFRGVAYNTRFGAELLPAFFFPLESADDLTSKVAELLVSRGLMPLAVSAGVKVGPGDTGRIALSLTNPEGINDVVRSVERKVRSRPGLGILDSETVLALDIVTHALEFDPVPDALDLWREALWGRALSNEVQKSIVGMLEHVVAAAQRGDRDAITEICDCLHQIVGSEVSIGQSPRTAEYGIDTS